MGTIKDFYKTDGLDYKYRRWKKYPTGRFDYRATEKAINDFLKELNVKSALEVGCGPGTWTPLVRNHTEKLLAVDISDTMIDEARKNLQGLDVDFWNGDIMDYESEEKFDLIFSIRAFEYFPKQEEFISKAFQMLNPGGKLFIITKTKASYWYGRTKIRKALNKVFPFLFYYEKKEFDNRRIKNIENFHQNRVFTGELKSMFKKNGFESVKVKPVIIRPPLFMRGKSEIPVIPPALEKPVLGLLTPIDRALSHSSVFTLFAESFSISGEKSGAVK